MASKATTAIAKSARNARRASWPKVRFGDVVRDVKVTVDRETTELTRFVAGEHMDSDDIHLRRWGELNGDYLGPAFHRGFREGQVLYGSRRTYLKKVAVAPFDGICANTTFVLESSDPDVLLPEILPFIMLTDTFTQHSIRESKGSVNPYINWKDIAKYEFHLPPKDEQRRIAELLWAADDVVEAQVRVLRSIETAWQMLIDSIVPDPNEMTKEKIGRLDDLCDMQNGRPFPSSEYSDVGFKLLRPGNLASNGRLIWPENATVFLDARFANENADWIIRPGDVVINLTAQSLEEGFMGRACLAEPGDESLLNQRLGRFIVKNGTDREYVFRILQTSRFRRIVESHCEGSKVRHTYFRHFADLPVTLLSQKEQQRVIQTGRDIDQARESANQAVTKAQSLSASLREHLLGGHA